MTPLCVCAGVGRDRFVTSEILETYLGRISGSQVLSGQIELGDGRRIDCAIFYSDLRGSVALSQDLDTPLIATADFAKACGIVSTRLGSQNIRGFDNAVDLVTYPLG